LAAAAITPAAFTPFSLLSLLTYAMHSRHSGQRAFSHRLIRHAGSWHFRHIAFSHETPRQPPAASRIFELPLAYFRRDISAAAITRLAFS
jgi:hypothetical protein